MRSSSTILGLALFLATGRCAARAANLPVPAGDVAALVAALDAANASAEDDSIVLAPGSTYALTAPHHQVTGLPEVAGRITIQGNGATLQRTGAAEFRILDVGASGDLTLDGVTIKGGKLTFTSLPAPLFSDGGAGIRVLGRGKLTISNATITQNTCTGAVCLGGGILLYDDQSPEVTLIDSTVSDNSAENGGGICLRHNDQILRLTRTTVNGNSANEGGGIGTYGHDDVTIVDSAIRDNSVSQTVTSGGALGGGILDVGGGTFTIKGTTISENRATANQNGGFTAVYGGGMGENGGATVTMTNSTVTGNSVTNSGTALAGGAGLFSEGGGKWTLNNVTISHNAITAQNGTGGGLETTRGIFTLRNTIVFGNTAAGRPDCSAQGSNVSGPIFDSFVLTEGHNLVGDTTGCAGFVAASGDLIGVDPLLGPLADNGGPTQTRPLLALSPALDAGDPGLPGTGTACEAVDQRGVGRPQGTRCDIGAYEQEVSVPTTSTTTTVLQTSTTVTTTTTLPGICAGAPAPTFVSIDCRLDVLVARVRSATDLGRLERSLEGIITKARAKKIQAEGFDAAGRRKQSLNALKKAIARTRSFIHKLRSLPGRKVIPPATSTELQDAANPILADMKTLRSAL